MDMYEAFRSELEKVGMGTWKPPGASLPKPAAKIVPPPMPAPAAPYQGATSNQGKIIPPQPSASARAGVRQAFQAVGARQSKGASFEDLQIMFNAFMDEIEKTAGDVKGMSVKRDKEGFTIKFKMDDGSTRIIRNAHNLSAGAYKIAGLLDKTAKKMPHFTDQDRPKKVKDIYKALKRDHPGMKAEKKARISAKFGKPGVQKQGPPYKGPLSK